MNERPRTITAISWIFVILGCVLLVAGLLPLVDAITSGQGAELAAQRPGELALVSIIQILAIVAGAFMLYGFNWARWLLVAWLGYHVILSILHPPLELLVHSVLFATVSYFLFQPRASAYFRGSRAEPR